MDDSGAVVRAWVVGIGGSPLVSLAVATNVPAALTGSASGGLTIALDAWGQVPVHLRLLPLVRQSPSPLTYRRPRRAGTMRAAALRISTHRPHTWC